MVDRICSLDGCDRPHKAHGYCRPHYRRFKVSGDPQPDKPIYDRHRPARERFEMLIERTEGCWFWRGSINNQGYGSFGIDGRYVAAHRYSFETHRGPIPPGLVLDHLCRTRHCVNPAHLDPVSDKENIRRGVIGSFAYNTDPAKCVNGHEFTPGNTYVRLDDGRKACRTCRREAQRRFRRAKADSCSP